VNLGFPRGASLPDPKRVLEGEGKAMRHIKFANLRELEQPFVRRYIQAAMEEAAPVGTRGTSKSVVKSSLAGKSSKARKGERATTRKKTPEKRGSRASFLIGRSGL